MAKIFITGSSDGLGRLAAQKLIRSGHQVWVHARNAARAEDARAANPKAQGVLIADLGDLKAVRGLAHDVNDLGSFDAVIHNAGIYRIPDRQPTAEGIPRLFMVNSLAPYMLTALIAKPKRLIYLSSGLHQGAVGSADFESRTGAWHETRAYAESKLHNVLMAFGVARRHPSIYSNAVEPGWVPTKMGGSSAPDDLDEGAETQVWLATSEEANAKVTGRYFFHRKVASAHVLANELELQNKFFAHCEKLSGVKF